MISRIDRKINLKRMKGLIIIKIDIRKSQVLFSPENEEEKAKLTAVWKILVDCVGDSRKLVPVGEYLPQKGSEGAFFHIEGLEPDETSYAAVTVEAPAQVYCKTCNKLLSLLKGDTIPICCGKMMDIVD